MTMTARLSHVKVHGRDLRDASDGRLVATFQNAADAEHVAFLVNCEQERPSDDKDCPNCGAPCDSVGCVCPPDWWS